MTVEEIISEMEIPLKEQTGAEHKNIRRWKSESVVKRHRKDLRYTELEALSGGQCRKAEKNMTLERCWLRIPKTGDSYKSIDT